MTQKEFIKCQRIERLPPDKVHPKAAQWLFDHIEEYHAILLSREEQKQIHKQLTLF